MSNDKEVFGGSIFVSDLSANDIDANGDLLINPDWDAPLYDVSVTDENRWMTAIQKVSPKSSSFWYDYGRRYNEKIVIKIAPEKDPQGRRCCDVLVYTRRTVGDVVLSAWQEYNKYLVS